MEFFIFKIRFYSLLAHFSTVPCPSHVDEVSSLISLKLLYFVCFNFILFPALSYFLQELFFFFNLGGFNLFFIQEILLKYLVPFGCLRIFQD